MAVNKRRRRIAKRRRCEDKKIRQAVPIEVTLEIMRRFMPLVPYRPEVQRFDA